VSLAFLIPSAVHSAVFALYPNARGATEGTLSPEAWAALARLLPDLRLVAPEVEGVFVDGSGEDGPASAALLSLDVIHAVVGELRRAASPTSLRVRILRLVEEAARGAHD
jgi:hypothetical protein